MSKEIKEIVRNSLEKGVKTKVVYNSAKLSQYFNEKDPVAHSPSVWGSIFPDHSDEVKAF